MIPLTNVTTPTMFPPMPQLGPSSSSPTGLFPLLNASHPPLHNGNNNTLTMHHSDQPSGHPSSIRPPNFEHLMLLHHAQQQHRLLQQNQSHQDHLR